jgi:4-alpha-glucanotransferase
VSGPDVEASWVDAFRTRRTVPADVIAAVQRAMGLDGGRPPGPEATATARRGEPIPVPGSVRLEDGTELGRIRKMPRDAPFGYHHLEADDGVARLLITGPGRCHLPPHLREWGWAVQLPSVRSARSWGIGDLADLRDLGLWSARQGTGFVAVSPLGAPNPGPSPEPSPYYPSTRRFGNPLLLRVEDIPGAGDLADLAPAGHALNAESRIDRVRVLELKHRALERAWTAGIPDRPAFEAWRRQRGKALERWATFCVLSERLGAGWQRWPEEFRAPTSPAALRVAADEPDRVGFHAWIQWCFDRQLLAASEPIRRVADMPVGVDPGGFDAWDWQDQLALGASVGAPPDRFNAAGQGWGLPPFIPHRLREAHYRPFIETVRAQLRHAGGLRIDHVLGLFRLWWIPAGNGPDRGAYVRNPTDELLEIIAIESHRAEAVVIGEDLGTVPPGVRRALRRRRLLSTRLAIFERVTPARYPRQSFAGVTTHDLPTIAGLLSGSDLDDQCAAGVAPDPAALAILRGRLLAAAGAGAFEDVGELSLALHRRLAASPAAMVAATLEDALGVEERPNLPGTTAKQRDNWSRGLPLPLERLTADGRVTRLAGVLRRNA